MKKEKITSYLVRELMLATGMSREGVQKNLRLGTSPKNFLVAKAWHDTLKKAEAL